MKLSIIIPVFNEEKTISEILKRVNNVKIPGIEKEIIVVDDGSTDSTEFQIKNHPSADGSKIKNLKPINHSENLGKGSAVRTGIKKATGDYIIIQDADLEYNPQDYIKLLSPVIKKKAEVVYGTRLKRLPDFSRDENNPLFFLHYLGNKVLSLLTSILYGQWITDMETGYKLFPKKAVDRIKLHAKGFEFEPEITAKLLKQGYKIFEVPISTQPRRYKDGKKLRTIPDGIKALRALIYYRFFS